MNCSIPINPQAIWCPFMSKRKLVIISASSRVKRKPVDPIPALQRYDGLYFRIIRKYIKEKQLKNIDVLIVSENMGLLNGYDFIPYVEPRSGYLGEIGLDKKKLKMQRDANIEKIKNTLGNYEEIYVNVGQSYLRLIKGFDKYVKCKVTYSSGRGLGCKARHMKEWFLSQ